MNIPHHIKKDKLKMIIVVLAGFVLGVITHRAINLSAATPPIQENVPSVELIEVGKFQETSAAISVIGKVESLSQAELKSKISEQVTEVLVNVGDLVYAGQVLVRLNNQEITAQLKQAEANLATEEARLEELEHGTREEELEIRETNVANAKNILLNAIRDSYTKSDDAVRNKIDQFFINPRSPSPQPNFTVTSSELRIDLIEKRRIAENTLTNWQESLIAATPDKNLTILLSEAKGNLEIVQSLLETAALTVNNLVASTNIPQTTIDNYKTQVATARTNLNAAVTTLSAAEEKITTAEATLTLQQAGATNEQRKAQKGRVLSAQARLESAKVQHTNTTITAPISGTIAILPIRIGELVTAGQHILSIVNTTGLQVKTFIASRDTHLISEGVSAIIEGGSEGVVTYIAPSINPNTKKVEVNIAITKSNNPTLIIGQFANVDITINKTSQNDTTFLLPLQAIKTTPTNAYVFMVTDDNKVNAVPVKLGRILGESVEITEGLQNSLKIIKETRGLKAGQVVEYKTHEQ